MQHSWVRQGWMGSHWSLVGPQGPVAQLQMQGFTKREGTLQGADARWRWHLEGMWSPRFVVLDDRGVEVVRATMGGWSPMRLQTPRGTLEWRIGSWLRSERVLVDPGGRILARMQPRWNRFEVDVSDPGPLLPALAVGFIALLMAAQAAASS